jgi:hypothetical protein
MGIDETSYKTGFFSTFCLKMPVNNGVYELGTSRNRRERAKFVPTGLANTGHVPSVRRVPELTDSPAQQVFRSSLLFTRLVIHLA